MRLQIRAGAVGGCRRYVRWQQWLKVAEAEGVGPVGWREKRRKKIWGGKDFERKNETLHAFTLQIFFFLSQ